MTPLEAVDLLLARRYGNRRPLNEPAVHLADAATDFCYPLCMVKPVRLISRNARRVDCIRCLEALLDREARRQRKPRSRT